jgi:ribosomal protein L37AE/L43A
LIRQGTLGVEGGGTVKGSQVQRPLLYAAATIVLLSLLVTVGKVTSQRSGLQHCPKCGAAYQPGDIVRRDVETTYNCRQCTHTFDGPPVTTFSWVQALENWLDP